MIRQALVISFFIFLIPYSGFTQETKRDFVRFNPERRDEKGIRIVFYNTENLFDTQKDSLKKDDDFLPEGLYRWTPGKFFHKVQSIAKVLLSTGGWDPPEIIGLAEIENRSVLNALVYRLPLAPFDYKIVHYESPDLRGIDVALLYRVDKFKLLFSAPLTVKIKSDTTFRTRDILYVKGLVDNKTPIHVFVNHWPSKLGGEVISRPHRLAAAHRLLEAIDSLLTIDAASRIVIMGDLNDTPTSEVVKLLTKNKPFVNLMDVEIKKKNDKGSYKFSGKWTVIDQIIVSDALLKQNELHVNVGACIFAPSYLLVPDEVYGGLKPFRSFIGPRYTGGYSDHLPVFVDLVYPN
jgi:hypothetical protein